MSGQLRNSHEKEGFAHDKVRWDGKDRVGEGIIMWAKLKVECRQFSFMWKLALQMLISVLAAHVHLGNLLRSYPEACLGEYIVFSLTDHYYFLALFPFLCLMWTSNKNSEAHRYSVLIRYRTRDESFYIRFLARALYLLAALAVHVGVLLAVGNSLPMVSRFALVASGNSVGIIVRQLLNLFCYVCVMYLLHGILLDIVGNLMLDTMLTTMVSLLDLMVTKLMIESVIVWTPWGHISYMLFGKERPDYQFYWLYWGVLLLLLFYLAHKWNGKRDFV